MSDIVERLRAEGRVYTHMEAADEIERLREERDRLAEALTKSMDHMEQLIADRGRLRKALLMWLSADNAGDGQECINAIAHARSVVGEDKP